MILETVKLRNFRGYKDLTEVSISNLTAFIGTNDAGKSTILEALEIFFNNSIVKCEREDLNCHAEDSNIEITCVFSNYPEQLIIDSNHPTTLASEYLLNKDGMLEVKKVFKATSAKPSEKTFIVCNHPTIDIAKDLLNLKLKDLKKRAQDNNIPLDDYNATVNSDIRRAIRDHIDDLKIDTTDLLVDKDDAKNAYDAIKAYFPIYALFQSDRESKDDDKEVVDPMKIAIQQALSELTAEIEEIKNRVRDRAVDTANRTLEKLTEMSPDLASELVPEFKTEPKFDSQFKLTIRSEDEIPINKRGSGVRRLILLNFFRAEAERLMKGSNTQKVIFAFEEPETSQHPNHQKMLISAFLDLSKTGSSQVLLTTHTPALGGMIPLESLRYITKVNDKRVIQQGEDEVFEKISETLGVLPEPIAQGSKAIILVEGKSDVTFINHASLELKSGGYLPYTFEEKDFAIIPIGGCGNLKYWITLKLINQFDLPYCVLLDSDKGTNEEHDNYNRIQELNKNGVKAYVTRKREPENYIHVDVLELNNSNITCITDVCDAKKVIHGLKKTRKTNIIEDYWVRMSVDQIREMEKYLDNDGNERFELTDIFNDFLSLVP